MPKVRGFAQQLLGGFDKFTGGPSMPGLLPEEADAAAQRHKLQMMATLLQANQPSTMPQSGMAALGGAVQDAMGVKDQYGADMIRAQLMKRELDQRQLYGAGKGNQDPAIVSEFNFAQQNGYKGSFTDYMKEYHARQANVSTNVQNADYYEGLTPEQRQRYVEANRTVPIETIGQVPTRVLAGGALQPLSTLPGESSAAATVAADEERATSRAAARVKVESEVPGDIATLDEQIRKATDVLNRFKRGDFQTGPVAGFGPALTTAGQDLESYIGEDVLQRLSQATFGALSEGERDFLRRSGMNRQNTEAANISILERRLTSLENAKRIAQQRLERAQRGEVSAEPTSAGPTSAAPQRTEAPPAALDYLRKNPDAKEQFRAKYGYLPEGF
jgi:hypothetical protein